MLAMTMISQVVVVNLDDWDMECGVGLTSGRIQTCKEGQKRQTWLMIATLGAKQLLQSALVLPETERASLVASLLDSFSGWPLADDGVEEAMRRDAEMDADPEASLSLDQFASEVRQARRA